MPSTNSRFPRIKLAVGLIAIPVVSIWNRLVTSRAGELDRSERSGATEVIVEHERHWISYLRGFHTHHGNDGTLDGGFENGSLVAGLVLWVESRCLRGYTIGDDVYLCPWAPRVVRVHQAGHTPAFGAVFDPITGEHREDGGLPDEPLRTFDVMLPGDVPHTFLRLTDRRGIRGAYRAWDHDGRIRRVRE